MWLLTVSQITIYLMLLIYPVFQVSWMKQHCNAESSERKEAVPHLMSSKRTETSKRRKADFFMCFSVPLSCPLVLCNHIRAKWQPEVSVINRVHVTRTRQQFEQAAYTWLSVPHHISVLSKNHWHVPSNSKNV